MSVTSEAVALAYGRVATMNLSQQTDGKKYATKLTLFQPILETEQDILPAQCVEVDHRPSVDKLRDFLIEQTGLPKLHKDHFVSFVTQYAQSTTSYMTMSATQQEYYNKGIELAVERMVQMIEHNQIPFTYK